MAKQQTKKDLQDKLELAQEVIARSEKQIAGLEKEVGSHIERHNNLLQEIGFMLAENDDQTMSGRPMFGLGTINNTPRMTLQIIAFRISKLQVYKKEYFDLKDRVLPIPKTIILQEERNTQDRPNYHE
jgi:hypothetical protein